MSLQVSTQPTESRGAAETTSPKRILIRTRQTLLNRSDGDGGRLLVFVVLLGLLGLAARGFFSQANWIATAQYASAILLLSYGEAVVIITGGIDLSVGAILGCSAMLSAVVMQGLLESKINSTAIIAIGFACGLLAGAFMGLINGLVITRMRVPPFIATLGMLGIATGVTYLIGGGNDIVNLPASLSVVGNAQLLGGWLTIPVLVAIAMAVVTSLLLSRTRFGLRTYLVGSSRAAAARSGMNVGRHLVRVYVFAGLMASVAGLLLMSQYVDASPTAGANSELDAIAAAVIGGVSLAGGRGTIFGTVIGAALTSTLVTGLVLAHVAAFWQTVAVGIVIILAVYADQLRAKAASEH